MLLIHGTGASTHSWAGVFERLSGSCEVLAADLPGHAFSRCRPGTDLSLSGMASALDDLLKSEGFRPDVIIGHSAGAAIGIRLASMLPAGTTCLISLNGALRPLPAPSALVGSGIARMLSANPFIVHMLSKAALEPGRVAALIRSTGSEPSQPYLDLYVHLFSSPSHLRATLRMMASWDLSGLMGDLRSSGLPLIQITAAGDRAVSPRVADYVLAAYPKAQNVRLPHFGHLVHEEDPQAIAGLIMAQAGVSQAGERKQFA